MSEKMSKKHASESHGQWISKWERRWMGKRVGEYIYDTQVYYFIKVFLGVHYHIYKASLKYIKPFSIELWETIRLISSQT